MQTLIYPSNQSYLPEENVDVRRCLQTIMYSKTTCVTSGLRQGNIPFSAATYKMERFLFLLSKGAEAKIKPALGGKEEINVLCLC